MRQTKPVRRFYMFRFRFTLLSSSVAQIDLKEKLEVEPGYWSLATSY